MSKILNTKQLADRLGYSITHIRALRWKGTGPKFFKTTDSEFAHVRYRLEDVEEWEKERAQRNNKGDRNDVPSETND